MEVIANLQIIEHVIKIMDQAAAVQDINAQHQIN